MDTKTTKKHICDTTELRISNDRGRCNITLLGNFEIHAIKELHEKKLNNSMSGLIVDCMMMPVPEGYSVIVSGHKSLKNYLYEKQTVSCIEFFLFCKRICMLFKDCHDKQEFYNYVFDYSAVYVDFGVQNAMFVYAPYASNAFKANTCGKLIDLVYLYTSDEDMYEIQNIKEVIKLFSDWEQSGYNENSFERLCSFVNSYINLIDERRKKDILSKSSDVFKRFVENNTSQIKNQNMDLSKSCICFSSGFAKNKQFICSDTDCNDEKCVVKVGRNKLWADMHIPDMLVSGIHAVVLYKENNFYIRQNCKVGLTVLNDIQLNEGDEVMLLNGSSISFGRSTYKIKIIRQ